MAELNHGYGLRSGRRDTFQRRGRWGRGFSDHVSGNWDLKPLPSQRQTSPSLSADRIVSCDSDLGQIQIVFAISCI